MKHERGSHQVVQTDHVPYYHTVIVGGGPIGLLGAITALSHCKPGEKIALLADRIDELGIRQQVLWLQQDVYDYIEKMVGPDFMRKYTADGAIIKDENDGYYITTGTLEKLFYATLEKNRGGACDIIETPKIPATAVSSDYLNIEKKRSMIIVQALRQNGEKLGLNPGEFVSKALCYKYLIAADGAKRSVARALGEKDILFETTQEPLHHTKHIVASFKLPEGISPQMCNMMKVHPGDEGPEKVHLPADKWLDERVIDPTSLGALRERYGWTSHTRPYSQIYTAGDVVYIGAEMPENLKDTEQRKAYALDLMGDQLPRDVIARMKEIPCDDSAYGQKMAQLKLSVFDINLGDVNFTLEVTGVTDEEETTSVIFFMGDARKNPLYTTGTGVQTGIREVMKFDELLANLEAPQASASASASAADERPSVLALSLAKYHAEVRWILDDIALKQDQWIAGRKEKEAKATQNFLFFSQSEEQIQEISAFIKKLDAEVNSLPKIDDSSAAPSFLRLVNRKLNDLRETYKKVFQCCKGETHITSYNGVHVKAMLADVLNICESIFLETPSVDRLTAGTQDSTKTVVAEYYQELQGLADATRAKLHELDEISEDLGDEPLNAQGLN